MKKVNQFVLLVAILVSTANWAVAQSKPGCDPKSCGPDNTKVEEAKVITDLRAQLQTSFSKLHLTNLSLGEQLTSYTVPKGTSDDESVMFLMQASTALKNEIIRVVPKEKLLPEISLTTMPVSSSKQQLIGTLKKDIAILEKQINALVK
jgi:hypothetical protein